jgi:tetratricopeptide (TPR) repeat protein
MPKRWQKADLAYLKRYAAGKRLEELAHRFKTDAATVRAKLAELGLHSKEAAGPGGAWVDPQLEAYEQGLKAMYRMKWDEAERLLARVAAGAEQAELRDRGAQLVAACRRKRAEGEDPAPAEPYLQAVFEKNLGDYDAALQLCGRGGRQSKDERYAYLAASIHALRGEAEEAGRFLALAIELDPKNRVHAYHDPDFAALRARPEFAALLRSR